MATQFNNNFSYGLNAPFVEVPNRPIESPDSPTVNNPAQLGTQWINTTTGDIFFMTKVSGGDYTWQQAQGASVITTSIAINPGPSTFVGDFSVTGDSVGISATTILDLSTSGAGVDLDLTSAGGSISIQASEDAALALNLLADGGANATIAIANPNGTGADAISLQAPLGGIDVDVDSIDLATVGAFAITAGGNLTLDSSAGDVIITANDIVSITGEGAFANAIALTTSDATSGIQINTGTTGLDVGSTGLIDLDAAASSHFTVTGASADLLLNSVGGSVQVTATEAVTDALVISATAGGMQLSAVGNASLVTTGAGNDINIQSTSSKATLQAGSGTADAIKIDAYGASGGIQIATTDTTASVEIANVTPVVSRTTTINGSVVDAANTDLVSIAGGGVSTDAGAEKEVQIATGATAVGLTLVSVATGNVSAAGNTTLNLATGNAPVGTTQVIAMGTGTGGGTKSISMGNVDGLTTISELGIMDINTSGTAATSIGSTATGGAVAINSATTVTTLAANANINNSGTGATTIGSATGGAISLVSSAASNFSVSGAGVDLTLSSSAGRVVVSGSEAVSDAVAIAAPAGAVSISGGAAATLGNVGLVNQAQAATAGPGATVTVVNNSRIGSITFGGYTQAAAATLILTLTNSFISATSPIIASVQNAGANDAQMQITRILQGSGTADITITNQGAAALNGDMVLSYIILA